MRIRPQEDGGVVAERCGRRGHGNAALGQEAGGRVPQHVGGGPDRESQAGGDGIPDTVAPVRRPEPDPRWAW